MSDVCVCFMFVKWLPIGFVDWLDKGLIYICEKSLKMCICLWPEFDFPEVTLCGWRDIKIQLLLLLLLGFSVWLLLSSKEMIVGRWYVQLAAIWDWICHYAFIYFFYLKEKVLSILFFFLFFSYYTLIWYWWIRQNGWRHQHVLT